MDWEAIRPLLFAVFFTLLGTASGTGLTAWHNRERRREDHRHQEEQQKENNSHEEKLAAINGPLQKRAEHFDAFLNALIEWETKIVRHNCFPEGEEKRKEIFGSHLKFIQEYYIISLVYGISSEQDKAIKELLGAANNFDWVKPQGRDWQQDYKGLKNTFEKAILAIKPEANPDILRSLIEETSKVIELNGSAAKP